MLTPEMFSITDPGFAEFAPFGICPGQIRDDRKTLVTAAGWYNQYGDLLGQGDLTIIDFSNIMRGLSKEEVDSFIVVPLPLYSSTGMLHRPLEPLDLVERCLYVIVPEVIYIFDARVDILERLCTNQNLPYDFAHRLRAYDIIADLIPSFH